MVSAQLLLSWIHILNYNYDSEADRILPFEQLELKVRDVSEKEPELFVPEGQSVPSCRIRRDSDGAVITLKAVGLYTVIAF